MARDFRTFRSFCMGINLDLPLQVCYGRRQSEIRKFPSLTVHDGAKSFGLIRLSGKSHDKFKKKPNMKAKIIAILVACAVLGQLKALGIIYFNPPVSIVQNGNFESSGGWSLSGNGGAWYGYYGGADGGAFQGLDSLNLSPLYQNVSTTPGQSYSLTFYMRGSYPAGQSPPFGVNVFWNSQEVGAFTLNLFSSDWWYESLTVVGGSDSQSRLEFRNPDPSFSAIDDVSLVAVPEPSTLALLGSGMAILLVWVRRK